MAFNVRSGGKAESVIVASTVKSGDLVRAGALVGIAEIDATLGDDGSYYSTLALEGVAHLPLSGAVNQGTVLYTATATGTANAGATATLTTADGSGSNLRVGVVLNTKTAGETDVFFKVNG